MEPTAERILSVLVDLYAKQEGVRIGYIIETTSNPKGGGANENFSSV